MMPLAFLVFLSMNLNNPKQVLTKPAMEDTTAVAYWKQRALAAELRAEKNATEARRAMLLASKSEIMAKGEVETAREKINELNQIIEKQKKQIEACEKK